MSFHVYKMKPHSTSFSPSNKNTISPQTRYFFTASSAGFRFRIQWPPSNFSTGTTERLHWGHALNGPVHSSQTRAQSAQWTQTLKQLLCCEDKKNGKFKRHPDHWEGNTFATFDPSKVTRVSQARGERWFILVRQFSHLHCGNRSGRRCCAFHQSTAARLTKRTLHGWENKCFLPKQIMDLWPRLHGRQRPFGRSKKWYGKKSLKAAMCKLTMAMIVCQKKRFNNEKPSTERNMRSQTDSDKNFEPCHLAPKALKSRFSNLHHVRMYIPAWTSKLGKTYLLAGTFRWFALNWYFVMRNLKHIYRHQN